MAKRKLVIHNHLPVKKVWDSSPQGDTYDMHPDEIKDRIADLQREMDRIINSGGRILMNDPLMAKLRGLKAELARAHFAERR